MAREPYIRATRQRTRTTNRPARHSSACRLASNREPGGRFVKGVAMTGGEFKPKARLIRIVFVVVLITASVPSIWGTGPFDTTLGRTHDPTPARGRPAAGAGTAAIAVERAPSIRLLRAGDDLQAALDSAVGGDTLVLEAGAVFTGNFALPPVSPAGGWITITSSAAGFLDPDTRVGPLDASSMPKLLTPNGQPAVKTVPETRFVQFIGIEF